MAEQAALVCPSSLARKQRATRWLVGAVCFRHSPPPRSILMLNKCGHDLDTCGHGPGAHHLSHGGRACCAGEPVEGRPGCPFVRELVCLRCAPQNTKHLDANQQPACVILRLARLWRRPDCPAACTVPCLLCLPPPPQVAGVRWRMQTGGQSGSCLTSNTSCARWGAGSSSSAGANPRLFPGTRTG